MHGTGNVLLDTSAVIAYLKGDAAMGQQIKAASVLFVPMTVVGELYCGAYLSRNEAKVLLEVKNFLSGAVLLGQTETTAQCYGQIRAELGKAGTPIPENDIWIAAHAREEGLPLVTRDAHFKRVSGLNLLNW